MEKINKLLEKKDWKIKTLGEITQEIFSGQGVESNNRGSGQFPAMKTIDLSAIKGMFFEKCSTSIDPKLVNPKKTFSQGDILIISQSGSREVVGKCYLYLGQDICAAGGAMHVIKHKQNAKGLIHAANSNYVRKQILKTSKEKHVGGMPNRINISVLRKIQIPLPPKHIQDVISNILDKYVELERELELRKKQYEYYKEMLLSSGKDKWEMKSLSEIATEIYSGNGVTKAQLGTGDYPAIRYGEIHNSNIYIKNNESFINPNLISKKKYCEYGDFLITRVSEDIENAGKAIAYLGEKCILGAAILLVKQNQNVKYLSYIGSSKCVRNQIKKLIPKGTVMNFRTSYINKIKILLPSLEEQEEIVSKLDAFRKMTEDFEEGIPKLLNLVRQQYEYYKEEMLKI